ncbi:MAG TPA: DUF488 domain-containing protein [Egibacteraceae bacterium]|nr:DUF488 domain-containing protein [Egibacteraceae bacterium]
MPLYTVGHGTLEREAFAALLVQAGVDLVVDVRRYPGSRRHPWMNRPQLQRWLPEGGVGYRWEEALGGRRRGVPDSPHVAIRNAAFRAYADHMHSDDWRGVLEEVLDEARHRTVAVMCSESVWWRCHRRLIADAATLLHDLKASHLMHDGRLDAHRVTKGARVAGDRIVYDVGGGQPTLLER